VNVPFSRYGACLGVCRKSLQEPLVIHHAFRRFGEDELYALSFTHQGREIPVETRMRPEALLFTAPQGLARLVIADDHTLIIETEGLGCRLVFRPSYGYGVAEGDGRHKVIIYPRNLFLAVDILSGEGAAQGPMEARPGGILRDRQCDFSFEPGPAGLQVRLRADRNEVSPRRPVCPVDVAALGADIRAEWDAFEQRWPAAPEAYAESACWSRYGLWSCFVRAQGFYAYDAIIMSRRFMTGIWSWDHCFNAMAMALTDGDAALNQWLIPFEHQAPTGALPDGLLPFAEPNWGVTKPPVHGWALGFLLDRHTYPAETLVRVRAKLAAWTEWWMHYRDADQDGLPEYPLSLDSGWDNTTLLDPDFFLAAPDLAAYLVLQMRTLARLSAMLDDAAGRDDWNRRAGALCARLLERLWTGTTFTAARTHTGEQVTTVSSLMTVMPLVLGQELPADVRAALVGRLEREFLTGFGLATEALDSPFYEADGYWLGPIWAPTTLLLVDGLRRGGESDLARSIARRFCDMVEKTAKGLNENFDARTGQGLRAPGYTWTAAVHLVLMQEYTAIAAEAPGDRKIV